MMLPLITKASAKNKKVIYKIMGENNGHMEMRDLLSKCTYFKC